VFKDSGRCSRCVLNEVPRYRGCQKFDDAKIAVPALSAKLSKHATMSQCTTHDIVILHKRNMLKEFSTVIY
jgi:hypothetical protein